MASTNKCLAKSNKSSAGGKEADWALTHHDAAGSKIDRAPSRTHAAKLRSGDYRVNFRDGNETTAYYTDNLEDAVNTAVEMARKRALEFCLTGFGITTTIQNG